MFKNANNGLSQNLYLFLYSMIVDTCYTFSDPIIPKKEAFINAKYAQLTFAICPSKDDNPAALFDDFNRQLWSCVRTAHVETSLRLYF